MKGLFDKKWKDKEIGYLSYTLLTKTETHYRVFLYK
jgi:hypothetical protein